MINRDRAGRDAPGKTVDRAPDARETTACAPSVADGRVLSLDPGKCRIWARNARRYEALDVEACASLLDGLLASGGQVVPAVVRPVEDASGYDYEVVAGARRHWCVSHLREQGHAMDFSVVVRVGLSDFDAFLLGDLENRERRDVTAYERAVDYADAVDRYCGGSQYELAIRLSVSEGSISRYVALARLPPEVLDAFGDRGLVSTNHARRLVPVVKRAGARVLRTARELVEEQARCLDHGKSLVAPRRVMARLMAAGDSRSSGVQVLNPVHGSTGSALVTGRFDPREGWNLRLPLPAESESVDDFLHALRTALEASWPGTGPKNRKKGLT